MIELKDVCFKYPKFQLKNLNLKINNGEIIAVTGNNASGKTTLIKLMAGLIKPKKGQILFDGEKKCKERVGVVLQNPDNQIIFNKVYDDIAFTLKNYKVPKEEFEKRIDDALKVVELSGFQNSETFSLSAGQKQRLVIANMLAIEPGIMIFDEASVYLDPSAKQILYKIFKTLKERGVTVIFATNQIEEIVYADKVIILNDGEIYSFKDKEELLKDLDDYRKLGIFIPLKLSIVEHFKLSSLSEDEEILKAIVEEEK